MRVPHGNPWQKIRGFAKVSDRRASGEDEYCQKCIECKPGKYEQILSFPWPASLRFLLKINSISLLGSVFTESKLQHFPPNAGQEGRWLVPGQLCNSSKVYLCTHCKHLLTVSPEHTIPHTHQGPDQAGASRYLQAELAAQHSLRLISQPWHWR